MTKKYWLAVAAVSLIGGQPVGAQAPGRAQQEKQIDAAIMAIPGAVVRTWDQTSRAITGSRTSNCHTRVATANGTYDFDWTSESNEPDHVMPHSVSGFANNHLSRITIPDENGTSQKPRFDALFNLLTAYWEGCGQ